jgi:hypothetical protein
MFVTNEATCMNCGTPSRVKCSCGGHQSEKLPAGGSLTENTVNWSKFYDDTLQQEEVEPLVRNLPVLNKAAGDDSQPVGGGIGHAVWIF